MQQLQGLNNDIIFSIRDIDRSSAWIPATVEQLANVWRTEIALLGPHCSTNDVIAGSGPYQSCNVSSVRYYVSQQRFTLATVSQQKKSTWKNIDGKLFQQKNTSNTAQTTCIRPYKSASILL